jgi:hypothetical protein
MAYLAETEEKPDTDDKPKAKSTKKTLVESSEKAREWTREINAAKKWMEKFTRTARMCERAYLDVEGRNPDSPFTSNAGKVNLFWSNVQVVLSAIYGRMPKAEVDRKFGDFQDDESRVAGIIMQRVLNGDIDREYDDTNAAMRDAVQDRFIVGMGQVWCRYEVEFEKVEEPVIDPMTGQPALDPVTGAPLTQEAEKIINEEAATDYVYWDDFLFSPCRRWRQCRWVARRVFMNEEELEKRFKLTDAQIAMIPMVTRTPEAGSFNVQDDVLKATPFKQAGVWEIWSKDNNCAYWFVEGCSFMLDEVDDPLELEDFFPCPQPVVATTLTKAFLPRADYAMCQDLYKELDRINAQISQLTQAVKAAGVYDKTAVAVKSLLTTAVQNALVPVDNWSSFVEKGGMKGVMDWLPIEQFANAIMQLTQRKAQVERDLYEVLGISDIMRGASVASETLGAQQLKVAYGGARLSNLQNEVARFVSGVMRIRANIVSNFFQPETLKKRSLIERTPDAALADPAIAMLKDFGASMYQITVTADSLAAPDWAAEKEARTEFMGAASNYIMAAGPVLQQAPELGAFLIQLLQWGAAGFKGSKSIEGVLDQAAKQLEQKAQQAQQAPPPPPTPDDQKNLASAKKSEADAGRSIAETNKTNLETQAASLALGIPVPGMAPPGGGGAPPGGPPMGPGGPGGPMPTGMPPMGAGGGGPPPGDVPAAPGMPPPLQPQQLPPMG